jgi:putative NIF3 family GTP cyclohydrolase 1 type 2
MNSSPQFSRRQFLRATALTGAAAFFANRLPAQTAASPMTAGQVIDLMKAKMGVKWNEDSYRDTVKGGDLSTPVTGVACCFMSTLDVLQRAHQAGTNLVVTHEPTWWSDPDTITDHVYDDAVYRVKREFIDKNRMVVWRQHDHWHLVRPDPFSTVQIKLLGWEKYAASADSRNYKFPPTPVKELAANISAKLESRSVRIIGDPEQRVTIVGRGSHTLDGNMRGLTGEAEAIIVSEAREVDSIEYVRDLNASGKKKALILVSHQTGEETGMTAYTEWLQGILPGMKVVNIKTNDRMWIA